MRKVERKGRNDAGREKEGMTKGDTEKDWLGPSK